METHDNELKRLNIPIGSVRGLTSAMENLEDAIHNFRTDEKLDGSFVFTNILEIVGVRNNLLYQIYTN